MSQFTSTRDMFVRAGCTNCTYQEWLSLKKNLKAPALFVKFFSRIELAWHKASAQFVDEEDAVSTVLQYLMKNVEKIEVCESKFSEPYIYSVAYNCLGSLRRVKRDADRVQFETSEVVQSGDGKVSLYDTAVNPETVEAVMMRKAVLDYIGTCDARFRKVIDKIVAGRHVSKVDTRLLEPIRRELRIVLEIDL